MEKDTLKMCPFFVIEKVGTYIKINQNTSTQIDNFASKSNEHLHD